MLGLSGLDWMVVLLFSLLVSIVWGVWSIHALIRKGFNEVIEGLQSMDEQLANREAVSKGKTCPACSASVEEGAKFCAKCGGKLG
jgi:hypothetical protein